MKESISTKVAVLIQRFDDFEKNNEKAMAREFGNIRTDIQNMTHSFVGSEIYAAFETKVNLKFRALFWGVGILFTIVAAVVSFTFTTLGQKLLALIG